MVFKITSIILTLTVVTSCTGRLYFRPLPIRKDESEAPTPVTSNFKYDQSDPMGLQKALSGNGIDYAVNGGGSGPPNQNDPDPNNYFGTHNVGPNKQGVAAQIWSANEEANRNQEGVVGSNLGESAHMYDNSKPNGELVVNVPSPDAFKSSKYSGYRYNMDGFGPNTPDKRVLGYLNGRHAHIHLYGPNKSGVSMGVNHPEEQQEHHLPGPGDQNPSEPDDNNQGNRGIDYGPGGNEQPWVGHEEGTGNIDRGDSHGTDFSGTNGYQPNGPKRPNPGGFGPGINPGNPGDFGPGPMKPGSPGGMNHPEEQNPGGFKPGMGSFRPGGPPPPPPQMGNQGGNDGGYEFGQNGGPNMPGKPNQGNFGGHNIILGGFNQTPGKFHKEGYGESDQVHSGHYFQ
ncbi:spidroin-2-like isoform X1 [Pectinophora gossypiella]|uniref:spidroin-2-like isoform X1 n=1 Tax=Pectinophora gossypiella TaxID=13191 RepID=UPI00214EE05D|nr:spidroin-2-like isoform X1 [Pectinophora gossypiella]